MHALIRQGASGAAVAALSLVAGLMSALPASATPVTGPAANGTYLALGDSVASGYVPPQAVPPPNYREADSFVGYPEDVARTLRIRVSNASCPGETTDSMLVTGVVSNGCENSLSSSIGYRTQFPLHVQYHGTQMEYALKYLAVHRHTQLATIHIGANDVFLCQETTTGLLAAPAFAPLLRGIEPYSRLLDGIHGVVLHREAVLEYPYDWRLSVTYNANRLASVAAQHGGDDEVRKTITIGTPFQGAVKACRAQMRSGVAET